MPSRHLRSPVVSCAEIVSIGLGFLAILIAIAIPLWIEWRKRPDLRVELGDNADRDDPRWRIVHVRVVNAPIGGWLGRFLLRNDANGCEAHVELQSTAGGRQVAFAAKWSATPEPLQTHAIGGRVVEFWDPQKLPAALVCAVPPTDRGQAIAIAIKHGGESGAFGFGPDLYRAPSPGPLRTPSLALGEGAYDVTVTVKAGQISAEGRFVLRNDGDDRDGLELREVRN